MALKHVSIIIDEQVDRRTFWTGGRKKTHGELFMQRSVLLMMTKFQGLNWGQQQFFFKLEGLESHDCISNDAVQI